MGRFFVMFASLASLGAGCALEFDADALVFGAKTNGSRSSRIEDCDPGAAGNCWCDANTGDPPCIIYTCDPTEEECICTFYNRPSQPCNYTDPDEYLDCDCELLEEEDNDDSGRDAECDEQNACPPGQVCDVDRGRCEDNEDANNSDNQLGAPCEAWADCIFRESCVDGRCVAQPTPAGDAEWVGVDIFAAGRDVLPDDPVIGPEIDAVVWQYWDDTEGDTVRGGYGVWDDETSLGDGPGSNPANLFGELTPAEQLCLEDPASRLDELGLYLVFVEPGEVLSLRFISERGEQATVQRGDVLFVYELSPNTCDDQVVQTSYPVDPMRVVLRDAEGGRYEINETGNPNESPRVFAIPEI
jgi:hypothetical protein